MTTLDRLRGPLPNDRAASWAVTVGLALFAFCLRVINLGYPRNLVFDETYYAKDAYSLIKFGYERSWPETANDSILAGNPDVMQSGPAFVVHPPVGKWLIGVGEQLFGMNAFGWRIASCVFGALLVAATIRLARRLSRSTLIGGIAGVLLTFDGLAFTMSRIALLDIFQAFFLVTAVACVVADRDWFRDRLADHLVKRSATDLGGGFGPVVLWRPWRLAAGVAFGLALGTKWNSIYVLAAFGVLSVLWDVGARRLAGADFRSWLALLADGLPAFFWMVIVAAGTYLATWTGWLTTSGGWSRDWAAQHPDEPLARTFGDALGSLFWYHKEIYEFHTGDFINGATHPYDANPAGWLLMLRPIGIDAVNDIKPGTDGCAGPENCLRVISGMGTPVLWWLALLALVVAGVWWIAGRDWRFGVPLVGVLSVWLPWFQYTDRPLFFFYAINIIPFSVIALSLVMGLLLGRSDSPHRRRGGIICGVAVALVIVNFGYLYPVLTDQLLPYHSWLSRMWLPSWI
ncbi:dolichyl-phosphate-mannose--protein mannosyltransferase [Nigerium massiliense]|uniref:dolichyl-phosphate-mannose--protein mannosyltransferase n=1 Tax=Nigerium massiliense TaxID=1522317 RepID=UPI000694AC8F